MIPVPVYVYYVCLYLISVNFIRKIDVDNFLGNFCNFNLIIYQNENLLTNKM